MAENYLTGEYMPMYYWLSRVKTLGDVAVFRLLEYYGDIKKLYYSDASEILALGETGIITPLQAASFLEARKEADIYTPYKAMVDAGIRMIPFASPDYPEKLRCIPDPPAFLFVKGSLPSLSEPVLAIVGTRDVSGYGVKVAEYFGAEMAKAGVSIVSGMARGVDGISQNACIKAGGKSYGVLGCGVDICYPKQNQRLYDALPENGGLISAFVPGEAPKPQLFPARNRIISALSDAVLVVEARMKSGSKITADMALEQGKDVYAVPGRITDPCSLGTNDLIRQGAGIADCAGTLLDALYSKKENGLVKPWEISAQKLKALKNLLPPTGYKILEILEETPIGFDSLYSMVKKRSLDLTVSGLRSELVKLCMDGYVLEEGGFYCLNF